MKKSKIIAVLVAAVLLVGCVFAISSSAAITESSFSASPEKALVKGVDYEYSFAVIGDAQCINLSDAKKGTAYTKQIYNWISANANDKNIQYVLGLGDIINTYKSSDTYYDAEWTVAKDSLAILDDAGIPYSLVRGNHDISSGMNATFGNGSAYYNGIMTLASTLDSEGRAMGGFYEVYTDDTKTAYKIETSYRKITAGDDKWLIVTLDWAPDEGALTWLAGILEAHPDYRAIITLHQFLQKDGAIIDDPEGTLPHENVGDANWGEVTTGGTVHPRTLWDQVLSKYANVEMILSGHIPVDGIVRTQMRGDNGNTVTCMLIDPQEMDEALSAPVGMVAMFYFSADGNVVHVEYISAVRALDGNDSTHIYRGSDNQFSLPLEYNDGWVETKYGYAPKADYDKYTFLTFLDDDGDPATASVYLGGYDRWVDDAATGGVVPMVRTQFTYGGAGIRQKKTLSVLMLKDYDATGDGKYQYLGDVCGTMAIDLNGNTYTGGSYPMLTTYTRTAYTTSTFKLFNGNVKISAAAGMIAVQTASAGDNGKITIDINGVNVSYDSDNTGTATAPIVTSYDGTQGKNSTVDITLTDCNIDVYNNAPSSVILFKLADSHANNDASVTFKGGTITGSTEAATVFYTLADGDSFAFGEGKNGYTVFKLPVSASTPTGIHKNILGENMSFAEKSRDDAFVSYSLEKVKTPAGSLGTIEVWLIGGQSNAAGYAIDMPSDAATDTRFTNGFENVLYYGKAEDNVVGAFTPVKVGYGNQPGRSGAEIGIASALANTGNMHAVIKVARGASYLYPDPNPEVSQNYGTWTSPSYIADNGVVTSGTKIGALYTDFMRTVEEGLSILEAQGYTPVIRGMWWMQGEAETWREALANEYDELLTALIGDVRADLTEMTGTDLSNMPFVLGEIASNTSVDANGDFLYNQPPYVSKVVEAQRSVSGAVANTYTIPTEGLERRDQWHFVADVQQYLGETFVANVIAADGKYSVTFNGNNVTAEGFGAYTAGQTVTLKLTPNGSYVIQTLTYKEGLGEATGITLTNGEYTFVMPEANVIITAVTYDAGALTTIYGTIPSTYASEDAYPFAVFKNGEFYTAYAKWNDILKNGASLVTASDKNVTILLRRDYSTSEDSASLQDLYTIEGEVTIDLGGKTLTRGSYHLFQIMAKKTTAKANPTKINIKNGTILAGGSTPFVINTRADALADHFYFTFDGVTFAHAKDSTAANLVFVTYTGGTVETTVTASFNNCVFDLSNSPNCTIFNLAEESGSAKTANVTVTNSVFKANTLTGISVYAATGNDSFILGDGVTFEFPSAYDASLLVVGDTSGKTYEFVLASTGDSTKTYTLSEIDLNDEKTAYGTIPADYTNAQTYPFILFKNKTYVAAYQTWNAFLTGATATISGASASDSVVLLVRRDYATSENTASSYNVYTFKGNITVELDNHTITMDTKSYLFSLDNRVQSKYTTGITLNNGKIVTYKNYTPFTINGNATSKSDWTVNVTCNNVTFEYHKSSTLTYLVIVTYANGTTDTIVNATFNDCVFDITNAARAVTLFSLKESTATVIKSTAVTVNGGEIKVNNLSYFSLYTFGKSGDSFVFGKGSDGKYTKITLPGGTAAPTAAYPVKGAAVDYVFGAPVASESNSIYSLCPAEVTAFGLKTNVTLYSDFVLNAYFPVLTGISSVKVNGISVAFKDLETTEIDGVTYYILPTEVASSEAAEDIAVSITLTYGEDSFSAKWTLGVVKYAEKALATEQTDITKAMLRDMLSYVRASYEYFATVGQVTPEACEIATAKIDAIIGKDYDENNAPVMEESAVLDPEGLSKATVSLGAKISFVFYPTEDAEKYTFTMGGAKLETEVKADGYIIVTTYAYAVRETVEYTVEGTDISGSYNLKAYYEYMAGEGNGSAELIALVERLFKYSESCEAYRNEVNS